MTIKNCKAKVQYGLPTEHERAPKVLDEITPILKGGDLEKKVKNKK